MCVFCSMYAKNGAKRAAAYSDDEPVGAARLAAGALVAIAGEGAAGIVRVLAEVADRRGGRDGLRLDV